MKYCDPYSIVRTVFDGYDIEREGLIHINQFPSLLNRLNKSQGRNASAPLITSR